MARIYNFMAAIVLLFLLTMICPNLKAEVTARAVSIRDNRFIDLDPNESKDARNRFSPNNKSQVILTIELNGPEVAQASKYGNLIITSAIDSEGRKLDQLEYNRGFGDPSKGLIEIKRRKFGLSKTDPKEINKLDIEMSLSPSARAAEKIIAIEGSVKLLSGDPTDVIVDSVTTKVGSKIEDPLLKNAGFSASIIAPRSDPSKVVKVDVSGNLDALHGIELRDKSGKVIKTSKSIWSTSIRPIQQDDIQQVTSSYLLKSKAELPEGTKLAITVLKDHKVTNVPLSFKNIPLP